MAKNSEIQYIRLYTEGSAARSVDYSVPVKKNKTRLPRVRKERRLEIRLDPLALCGTLVAAVMLIMMVAGVVHYCSARREAAQLEEYVEQLQDENNSLLKEYQDGYDLKEIEEMALAIGMVPQEKTEVKSLPVEVNRTIEKPSAWETFCTFLSGLFA